MIIEDWIMIGLTLFIFTATFAVGALGVRIVMLILSF
jgi:hypothetical protein